tara:strand:- start:1466 stop:2161 length:696 start_codon:yes stop_codon:yes gene_type:complete
MNEHFVMQPFSNDWFLWNSVTLFFIALIIIVSYNSKPSFKSKLASLMGIVIALEFIAIQYYYIQQGIWTAQDSLPFHLCRLMWFVSLVTILTRNQIAFELLLFVGMIGGMHSMLTPEFTHGINPLLMVDYFMVHGGLIVVPLYCVFALGMRPRKQAWYKSILYLQIFVVSVGLIDYLLGANYMYLAVKPVVENPFLIGDWPYYIIGLEFATLLHAFLVYLPFYFKNHFLEE